MVVRFNIDEVPIFCTIEQQSGKGFENMFFSLHANLYKNCLEPSILNKKDRDNYTGILTGESDFDDDVQMDEFNYCEVPYDYPASSAMSSPELFESPTASLSEKNPFCCYPMRILLVTI
ncbi:unnamed protein product [Ambrosiozyma monospora]|uniref:Unnamed protein product n=1 Tax=Ambrosiozyma monospora TaxID=43982 RepID=A0ACB5U4G5_AMBMO|nr:unnamed protein product [Ambrosiozyma monospora]